VLCRAVRAGQLSKRQKTTRIVVAMITAIIVNAIGHPTRCGVPDFDPGCSALSTLCSDAIDQQQITSKKKAADICPQKITAPHAR
jgi:hypothetical protein